MKRSIFYAGMISVMGIVPAMTEQAFAVTGGNTSDALSAGILPTITWIEFPDIAPDLSSAGIVPPPTTTTPGEIPTVTDEQIPPGDTTTGNTTP